MSETKTWEEGAAEALDEVAAQFLGDLDETLYRHWLRVDFDAARKARHQRGHITSVGGCAWVLLDKDAVKARPSKRYVVDLLAAKQHSYGHRNILDFGVQGILVRISDKLARYENLLKRAEAGEGPKLDESIEDTLVDIVGYAVVYLMLTDGTFERPLAADIEPPPHPQAAEPFQAPSEVEAAMTTIKDYLGGHQFVMYPEGANVTVVYGEVS